MLSIIKTELRGRQYLLQIIEAKEKNTHKGSKAVTISHLVGGSTKVVSQIRICFEPPGPENNSNFGIYVCIMVSGNFRK
jgi:hypothetical protein